MAVLWISAPIILIDEVLKYLTLNVIGEKDSHQRRRRKSGLFKPPPSWYRAYRSTFENKGRIKSEPRTPTTP